MSLVIHNVKSQTHSHCQTLSQVAVQHSVQQTPQSAQLESAPDDGFNGVVLDAVVSADFG